MVQLSLPGRLKVLLAVSTDPIFRRMAVGFARVAFAHNWAVWAPWMGQYKVIPPRNMPFSPDICVIGPRAVQWVDQRILAGRPVVALGLESYSQPIGAADVDDRAVAEQAAQHLLAKGLRTYGAFAIAMPFADRRVHAFRAAIDAAGMPYDDRGHLPSAPRGNFDPMSYSSIDRWLRSLPHPAGVLACADTWGEYLMTVCSAYAIRVPDQISLVSVDNDELTCQLTNPPMSSVAVPWETIGEEAANLVRLWELGQSMPADPVLVKPTGVVARLSSDTLAQDDREMAAALTYIRAHAQQPFNVPDMAAALATNRRGLERRFQRAIGRSIMDEVRRVRVDIVKRLLGTTALNLDDIAERAGFASGKRLGEAFRRETGLTPSLYRNQFRLRP